MAWPALLSRADLIEALPIREISLHLTETIEQSRTGQGEQLRAEIGDPLWTGEIVLGPMTAAEAGQAEVMIDLLRGSGRSFLAYDTRRPAPLLDPDGAILGAATPFHRVVPADARLIALGGLPALYKLSVGDYIGWTYGADPLRYALHRVAEPVTANGAGATVQFEISPPCEPGAGVSTPVTLVKAACKAVLVAGSARSGSGRRFVHDGARFNFVQATR